MHHNDRHWLVYDAEDKLVGSFTDYNWEVTHSENLPSELFHYSANAYYLVYTWLPARGWSAEVDERR